MRVGSFGAHPRHVSQHLVDKRRIPTRRGALIHCLFYCDPNFTEAEAEQEGVCIVCLITEFIKEDSPLLPNPCHFQYYDRSMLSPAQPGSEGCSPKMCAVEINSLVWLGAATPSWKRSPSFSPEGSLFQKSICVSTDAAKTDTGVPHS